MKVMKEGMSQAVVAQIKTANEKVDREFSFTHSLTPSLNQTPIQMSVRARGVAGRCARTPTDSVRLGTGVVGGKLTGFVR